MALCVSDNFSCVVRWVSHVSPCLSACEEQRDAFCLRGAELQVCVCSVCTEVARLSKWLHHDGRQTTTSRRQKPFSLLSVTFWHDSMNITSIHSVFAARVPPDKSQGQNYLLRWMCTYGGAGQQLVRLESFHGFAQRFTDETWAKSFSKQHV